MLAVRLPRQAARTAMPYDRPAPCRARRRPVMPRRLRRVPTIESVPIDQASPGSTKPTSRAFAWAIDLLGLVATVAVVRRLAATLMPDDDELTDDDTDYPADDEQDVAIASRGLTTAAAYGAQRDAEHSNDQEHAESWKKPDSRTNGNRLHGRYCRICDDPFNEVVYLVSRAQIPVASPADPARFLRPPRLPDDHEDRRASQASASAAIIPRS